MVDGVAPDRIGDGGSRNIGAGSDESAKSLRNSESEWTMSKRQTKRITRQRKGNPGKGEGKGTASRRGKRKRRGKSTDPHPYGPPPPYQTLDNAPRDLLTRAQVEKLPWIQAYVARGSPRGQLLQLARDYAVLQGKPESEIPPRATLYHWAQRYKHYGMLGLVDAVRGEAGTNPTLTPEAEETLEILFTAKGGRTSIPSALRLISDLLGADHVPSYDAARAWVRDFKAKHPAQMTIGELGVTGHRSHQEPSIKADQPRGGRRLAIDSTVADIWIRVPSPDHPGRWKPVRPALTVIEDVGSRSVVTFGVSLTAVSSHLMLALFRRAVLQEANWAELVSVPLPLEIVVDAGSEHRGVMQKQLENLRIRIRGREENRPQQNARVERVIQTFGLEVFSHLPGYSKTEKRFEPYGPAEGDVKRSLKSLEYDPYRLEILPEHLLSLRELEAKILGWAVLYNARAHPGLCPNDPQVRSALAEAELERRLRDAA
jgi:hypothetical protein